MKAHESMNTSNPLSIDASVTGPSCNLNLNKPRFSQETLS